MIAQYQQQPINQQSPDKSIFQFCQQTNKIIVNIKIHKILKQLPPKYVQLYKINDIIPEGKYKQLRFGLSLDTKLLTIQIDKSYYYSKYFKKYQVILLCKNYLSVIQQFLAICKEFLEKNIMEVKVLHFDVLSLCYVKDYKVVDYRGQPQIRRTYIKISPFMYKRNFYIKIKQSQQFYSAVIHTIKNPTQQYQLPTNQQFYKATRTSYVDQLYLSQSLIKRFPNRFYVFYQAFSLLNGLPLQNKYIKQYYAKCASKCMITSYRFKKIILNIKIPYIMERQKDFKSTLIINCIQIQDEQTKMFKQILFYIEVPTKSQPNQRNVLAPSSQNFLKNLEQSIQNNYDAQFISIKIQNNCKYIKIMNQVGFCRLFTQFYFYMQRLVFRNLKINRQIYTNTNDNSIFNFILPKSQQFIGKKFGHSYQIQIRSLYSFTQNNLIKNQDQSSSFPNKNKFHSVVMFKRKLAQDISRAVYQKFQFLHTNDQIKGLNYYMNQVLMKWSLTDSNYHLVNFVYNYMNIIVDKNKQKQKNFYKNTTNWKAVVDDLSALVEMITKSLSSSHTTVILYMLRTYEEFPAQSEYTKAQITEGQQVMTLTFKFMRLSIAGWVQVIPSCIYYFQMKKGFTILYHPELDKQVNLESKKTKQFNQRVFRDFLKKTLQNQYQLCNLPPLAYSKS